MAQRKMPANVGEHIGGYRLERLLAQGGMGSVYIGRHLVLGRPAAIKVLDSSLAHNDEYVGRFLREARLVNDVRHPNIVDIFDFLRQQDPPRVACVMELLDGPTLEATLAERRLTTLQTFNIMNQLVSALSKVHSRGVIHRDLKPSNIVIIGELESPLAVVPSVKILDFGIAKVSEAGVDQTGPGQMLGTPAYMAPEQISGTAISPATDVYALGELVYEMLTGQRAFDGNARQVIKLKMIGQPPEVVIPPEIPRATKLSGLIRRSMDADPAARPALEELYDALNEARLELPPDPLRSSDEEIPSLHTAADAGDTMPSGELDAVATTPAPELQTGPPNIGEEGGVKRLGDYSLYVTLPPRGMTSAYVARRDGMLEMCHLRRLLQQLESNDTAVGRFRREAKIMRYLRHPRIPKTFDARLIEGTFCIASELVLGVTLETVLERMREANAPVPIQVFAPIALGVLDALHYAHDVTDEHGNALGIVHRDVTPGAITLSFSGDVKLSDFGVARATVDDFRTAPGMAVGSLEYMSPEQVRSEPLDRRSDLYALAVVMYEILAGRKLIEPKGMLETLRSIATDVPPPLTSLRPDVPLGIARLIEGALAKAKDERPATADMMARELRGELGRFADASRDVVGDFVRQLMPDAEQKTLEMLAQIRSSAESQQWAEEHEPKPADEPTMTVRQRLIPRDTLATPSIDTPEEPPEPSLLTMPGAPAPLEKGGKPVVVTAPAPASAAAGGKRKIPVAAIAAAGLAVAVLTTAIVVAMSSKETPVAVVPPPGAQAAANPQAPTVTAKDPPPPPPPAVAKATPPPPPAAPPPAPVTKRVTTKKTVRRAAPPPPRKASTPPPPPPPPPAKPKTHFADLDRAVAKLHANPGDVALFDKVHDRIWSAAKSLPSASRRRVKIKLDAAQRTYAVSDLDAALDRLKLASAKAQK